jgi:hypothetical protein
MNDLDLSALLAIGLGLLIRFGIPILLTGLAAWGLRRLDQRWQRQSEHIRPAPLGVGAAPAEVRCWEQADCPEAKREACPAYARPSVPCWQVFREQTGTLSTGCLVCGVFLNAPARS